MRISLVSPHASTPGPDAGVPGVVALAQALAGQGHEITLYARKDCRGLPGESTAVPGVKIVYVAAGPAASLLPDDLAPHIRPLGEFLARRWREEPPQFVHAYSWPGGLAALAGARGLDVPVAVTFHELGVQASLLHPRQARGELARVRFKISLARGVDAVLARSAEERSVLASLGVPRSRLHVVPWGVDTAHFCPDGQVDRRSRLRRLVTVWPAPGRGRPDLLFRVLADIPDTELVILGGPARRELAGSRDYRDLVRMAARAQVADRVVFTGGVPWRDLPPLLRSADLMVSTSSARLFDGAALAAMACGTAMVAPATGFYSDLVIDGTTGLLIPPGRPYGLARRIRRLLDSPVQLEALGIAAADRSRSRYAWDQIAREAVRAYRRCLPGLAPESATEQASAPGEIAGAGEPVADLVEAL